MNRFRIDGSGSRTMIVVKGANLAVVFLLELAALAGVGTWGFTTRDGLGARLLAGLGGPAVLIVLWALFGAPDATYKVHGAVRVAFELGWFGIGVAAFAAAGYVTQATVFAVTFAVSKTLAVVWHQ
ncbi:YrdB family protein [Yinghuangia seranimata]|uniref:YrdB family protein n=1 Tax=Yinghuangia seranimata TaxID=408067 RepID=UPI00248B6A52|nr:YrdB family protein [Yinghuangia seranimata]MDI2130297.1 YrdB family protein [Yinghuangia seranimata]